MAGFLTPPAWAQLSIDQIDADQPEAYAEPETEDPAPALELPETLPPVVAFETMTQFETDGVTPNSFAIDAASISIQPRYVMATISVKSRSGAITTGYYGFACQHLQYRLLAFPGADKQWRASSNKVTWREVRDSESRNRQYRAVYDAACRLGGRSAESASEILRHLNEGRQKLPS